MVCPFCQEKIQKKAIKCKHCGSMLGGEVALDPRAVGLAGGEVEPADVPWFRKPVFVALTVLLFFPATIVLMWTGNIYYRKRGGKLASWPTWMKIVFTIGALAFVATRLASH